MMIWLTQEYTYGPGDHVCYSGNETPGWFEFQSTGSHTNLELQPGWFSNKFLGFALCAVVSFPGNNHESQKQDFGVWCDFKFKTELDGDWEVAAELSVGRICYVESDHVILGYHFRTYGEDHYVYRNDTAVDCQFHFYLVDLQSSERIEMVKKCGIRLLYAQGFDGESMKDRNRSFSLEDEDEERHLRPKRLRADYSK